MSQLRLLLAASERKVTDHLSRNSTPQCSPSAAAEEAAPRAASGKFKKKVVADSEGRKFYVVWSAPESSITGLWHCEWTVLALYLPPGGLVGSGVCLESFSSEGEARSFWKLKRDGAPCPRRP